ncbi:hypothetical protein IQ273_06520 [Nodosilinea sp. LEGE 07298]|nr:hypothetical protein [Nodosilinea sp. LEGE 07298]
MNDCHVKLIHLLFSAATQNNLPLCLQGVWAIDAKLNCITCDHENIDAKDENNILGKILLS